MSLKTKLLELFKYEPDKDGAQTFNIKSALNDNWDKIEAWAQSVKTALAGLVPTSRTVNGKTLSADVTLTGDDIAMGADDAENLRTAMAKRAMNHSEAIPQNDCDFITNVGVYRGYNDTKNMNNEDIGTIVVSLPWDSNSRQQIVFVAGGKHIFHRAKTPVSWGEYTEIAQCVAPEVHELPLVNGATAEKSCVYYKTQENLVIGKLSLQASAAAYQEIPVAVLPEGFRPPQDFPFIVASCARKGVTWEGTGWGRIAPDGTIFVYQNIAWGWVEAQFSFIAAS